MSTHKRRIVRKIKRNLKRNNTKKDGGSAQNKSASQSSTRPHALNENNENMLKLMALLGANGRGGVVSNNMDPGAFLHQREAQSSLQNEITRKKREKEQEERDIKRQAQIDKLQADLAKAEHKLALTKEEAEHEKELTELELQTQGVSGELRNIEGRKRKIQQTVRKNAKLGDLSKMQEETDLLKEELKSIEDDIGASIKTTPEYVQFYEHAKNTLNGYIKELQRAQDLIRKGAELRAEESIMGDVMKRRAEAVDALVMLNRDLQAKIQLHEEEVKKNEERNDRYIKALNERDQLTRLEKIARDKVVSSRSTYGLDENGDLLPVYTENDKLPVIEPKDDMDVKGCSKELNRIIAQLNKTDQKKDQIEWEKELEAIMRAGSAPSSELRGRIVNYNKELKGKTKLTSEFDEGPIANDVRSLAKYYFEIKAKMQDAFKKAREKYEKAKEHNAIVNKSINPPKVEVTDEMMERVIRENSDLDARMKEHMKSIDENVRKAERLKEIKRENVELTKQLQNTQDPSETQRILTEYDAAEVENKRLQAQLKTNNIRNDELEKIKTDTQRLQVQNELFDKRLTEYGKNMDGRLEEERKAIEARILAETQKELNQTREITHKKEQEKRLAECELNVLNSESIKNSEEEILQERIKHEKLDLERRRTEELKRSREEYKEKELAAKAMELIDVCTKDKHGYANLTAQLKALGDRLMNVSESKLKDDTYTKKKVESIVNMLKGDHMLLWDVTKHLEERNHSPIRNPDELYRRLDTPQRADDFERMLNKLQRERKAESTPMKPGRMYRFYGAPQPSSMMKTDVRLEEEDEEDQFV